MNIIKILFTIVVLVSPFLLNCSSPKENKNLSSSDIAPGTAKIVGTISEIEPISENLDPSDPCSKAPCVALVNVSSAVYGSGFPQLEMGKDIKVKFNFTLVKTTKELFPNMEEEYPGLKVGQEFTGVVSYIETIDENAPKFQIYAYEAN